MDVGIDLSLESPGLCIWEPALKSLSFYFWPQRVREKHFTWTGQWSSKEWQKFKDREDPTKKKKKTKRKKADQADDRAEGSSKPKRVTICPDTGKVTILRLLPKPAAAPFVATASAKEDLDITVRVKAVDSKKIRGKQQPEMQRYETLLSEIIECITTHVLAQPNIKPRIGIEGYAFNMQESNCMTQLCEIGGILRFLLHQKGWTYRNLPPASIKKFFTGTGNATKGKMIQTFIELGIIPKFYKTMLFDEECKNEDVKPIQDMVDAFAIVHVLQLPDETTVGKVKTKTKTNKRKLEV